MHPSDIRNPSYFRKMQAEVESDSYRDQMNQPYTYRVEAIKKLIATHALIRNTVNISLPKAHRRTHF